MNDNDLSPGTDNALPIPDYKDRRTALLVFGILEILLGVVAWLLVVLLGFATVQMMRQGMPAASMIPSLLMYAVSGAVFVVLGIGSIRCRRWARALWVAITSGWTLFGIMGLVMAIGWLPKVLSSIPTGGPGGPPPEVLKVIMIVVVVVVAALMILLPLGLWMFYRTRNVQATCEAEHPEGSWTDAHPVPVLSAALWMSLMGLMVLGMGFLYGGVHPFFGIYLRGPVGLMLWLVMGVLYGATALGLLGGRTWGWVLGMVMMVVSSVSAILTYVRSDARELFEGMGMPDFQLAQVEQMGMMSAGYMISMTLAVMVPLLLLLGGAAASLRSRRAENRNLG